MSDKVYQILVKDQAEANFVKEKYRKIVNDNLLPTDNIALEFCSNTSPKWIVLRPMNIRWYPYDGNHGVTKPYTTTSFDNLETTLENLKSTEIKTKIDEFELCLDKDGLHIDGQNFFSYDGIDRIWKYVNPEYTEIDGFSISTEVEYVTIGCSTISYDTFIDIYNWVMENRLL